MSSRQSTRAASLRASNVGGIDETEVEFTPGVTILEGENATNRTSLLQAIMAALGSDRVSVKADAERGEVELELDGETYTRELTRRGSTVVTDGEPYLEDSTLADLFAFLLETNEARRAVVTQENLRELIMRPVDTDEIQREIEELLGERRDIDRRLEELDSLKGRLPSLEERRTRLESEIEDKREELAATEAEIAAADADLEESREEQAELEERLEALRSNRSDLEDVRYDLETERESLESLRATRREAAGELEELPETPREEIDELESEIDRLRERKGRLESDVADVQSVISFNQEMLEDGEGDVLEVLDEPPDDVTEELTPDRTVTCWTCGSEVPETQIETTVERLRELSRAKLGEVDEIESRIDEATAEVRTLRERQRRREQLETTIDDAEGGIEESEATIERLQDRRTELEARIEELEGEIEAMEDDGYEEVLELHKDANELEYELGRLEGDLEDVEAELAELESRLEAESELRSRREDVEREIESLRTEIDRVESAAIAAFNDHMESVIDILGYGNLERVWLERRAGGEDDDSVFELHIVRETAGGTTYEDTIDHLSESEREVTGLVFALAGYLTHEVYEDVPFMLLDSLEAIDADRIARLVEYVEGYSDHLVVALLPEDAAALPDEYARVTDF